MDAITVKNCLIAILLILEVNFSNESLQKVWKYNTLPVAEQADDYEDFWEAEDSKGISILTTTPPISMFNAHFNEQQHEHDHLPFRTERLSQTKAELDILNQHNGSLTEAPPTENGKPINVDISVLIIQVRDIKELSEELTLELNLRMYWKDSRLASLVTASGPDKDGQPKKFAAISIKTLDRLWYPDVYLDHVKSVSQPAIITRPASLRVYSDTTVKYSARFTIVMSCPMDFHMYPADTQKCSVDVKSYAYTNQLLDIKWSERGSAYLVDKLELPNFDVGLDLPENFTVETKSGQYSGVRFTVVLRRKLSYHLLQTYFPSILFVTISWLSFLVSPESVPARMTLSMTTLLTLVSMFSSIRNGIPSVSYIKALDIWMFTCVFFVHATLVEYAIVLKISSLQKKQQQKTQPQPNALIIENPATQYEKNLTNAVSAAAAAAVGRALAHPAQGQNAQIPAIYNGNGPNPLHVQETLKDPCNTGPRTTEFSDPTSRGGHGFQLSNNRGNNTQDSNCGGFMNWRAPFCGAGGRISPEPGDSSPDFSCCSSCSERNYASLVPKIEFYTAVIVPCCFVIFNMCYWPWMMRALDYVDDVTAYYKL